MLQGKESSPLQGFIFFFKWLCQHSILYLPSGGVFRWWLFSCWFVPINVFLVPDIYFILHWVLILNILDKIVGTWQYIFFSIFFKYFPYEFQNNWISMWLTHCSHLKVGSIEGRVGVHHIDDSQQSKNFTFKCHREGNDIFSVNSLNFHPVRFITLYSFINYMWGLWFYFNCLTFVVRSVQMQ